MASRIALLCLLGLLAASPAIASSGIYYQLALMWPGAYCEQTKTGCCKPTTGSPARDFYISDFSVYNATTNALVSSCNGKTPFDPNKIIDLQGLKQYWSNIKCPSNDGKKGWKKLAGYGLCWKKGWKNTWKKSGACSGLEEKAFFETALTFRSRINPLVRLKAENIAPDLGLYGVKAITNVFKAGINATPLVQCSMGPSEFGKYQLYKLYFCASEDGTFIDCPIDPKIGCPAKEIIFYPFQKWMLKQSAAAYDAADPFVLPGVAMDE